MLICGTQRYLIWLTGLTAVVMVLRPYLRPDKRHPFHSEPLMAAKRVRVAVYDSRGQGHEEVLGPLLYSLTSMPEVQVTVYRDSFLDGFTDLVAPFFRGPFRPASELYGNGIANRPTLDSIDAILFLTAEFDLEPFLREVSPTSFPNLRMIGIVHRSNSWTRVALEKGPGRASGLGNETAAYLYNSTDGSAASRLQFIALSDHVRASLHATMLAELGEAENVPKLATFVPIQPLPIDYRSVTSASEGVNAAAIQGYLVDRWRKYQQVFAAFADMISGNPTAWGISVNESMATPTNATTDWRPEDPSFELHLVGKSRPDVGPLPTIPDVLQEQVRIHDGLPYTEYYRTLGKSDILILAFAHHYVFTHSAASSSIPAAIMARVPVLVSRKELSAYSYLEPPAFVMRHDGEDEAAAIARLRLFRTTIGGSDTEWDLYEQLLLAKNERTLRQMLSLDA